MIGTLSMLALGVAAVLDPEQEKSLAYEARLVRELPLVLPMTLHTGEAIELVRTFAVDFGAFADYRDPALNRTFQKWDAERVRVHPSDYALDPVGMKIYSWMPRIDQPYGSQTKRLLGFKRFAVFQDPEGVAYHLAHTVKRGSTPQP